MRNGSNSSFAVTSAGLARMKLELQQLSGDRKMALIERLGEAQSGAEFVENSELLLALEELKNLNHRIERLKFSIEHASLIEEGDSDGVVRLGSYVTVQFTDEEPERYRLVGTLEADPNIGYVSDISPLGRAIIGQSASSIPLQIETPGGLEKFKILEVA